MFLRLTLATAAVLEATSCESETDHGGRCGLIDGVNVICGTNRCCSHAWWCGDDTHDEAGFNNCNYGHELWGKGYCPDLPTTTLSVAAVPQQPSFEEWAAMYGENGGAETKAKYERNVEEIDRLNALNTTAEFGVNKFSGMSSEEFAAIYLTNQEPEDLDNSSYPLYSPSRHVGVASSVDWVKKGGVTPVKDQKHCGSCWTFSAMATVEAHHKIRHGETLDLSEQQLLACSGAGSSHGGSATKALRYLEDHAACLTSSYQYHCSHTDTGGSCKSCTSSHVLVSKVTLVSKAASALASAVNDSPVSVSLQASGWKHYTSGVLQGDDVCKHDHAVLVVGYTSSYWKIKNSWGTDWGEHGYIQIERGGSNCGKFGIFSSSPRAITLTSDSRRRRKSSSRRRRRGEEVVV